MQMRDANAATGASSGEPSGARATSTAVKARGLLPSLSPAEQRVARVVIGEAATAAKLTITELAERASTSETTVIRFCRAMGFAGYPQLRLTLAAEAGRNQDDGGDEAPGSDISPTDELGQVVKKIAFADARAVEDTGAQLDIGVLERVVDAVVAARRVDIYGVGASACVAYDFQQKLHRIGRMAYAWSDMHLALTSAALLGWRQRRQQAARLNRGRCGPRLGRLAARGPSGGLRVPHVHVGNLPGHAVIGQRSTPTRG